MPAVAYIIVSWNNRDLLEDCIKSIQAQDYPQKRIIMVDNASSDDSIDFVRNSFPGVDILAQTSNYGFAKANNIGIKEALNDSGVEYVVLLNTDARLDPDWTSTLVRAALTKPKAAMLQSVTLDYYDHSTIDSTHIYIARNGQGTQGSWRYPLPRGQEVPPQKVFGCNAAAILITRKFIEAQPFKTFFDETMFMYLEDVDVAARATIMGWDNYVIPGTRAYHMGSASSSKNPSFSLYMTFRNNTGLLIKNLPLPVLLRVFLRLPKADRASVLHLRRIGKPEAVPAVFKGRLVSIIYIPVFLLKRWKLMRHRDIDTKYLWQLMRRGF